MSLYEKLQVESLSGHEAFLQKVFDLRKKNITRQNSADMNKRFEAENMLKALSDLQTLLELYSEDFPYDATVVKLYDYICSQELGREIRFSQLKEVMSGAFEQAQNFGNDIKQQHEFALYNEYVDIVNWIGGNLEKIDLSLPEEEIVFNELVNNMEYSEVLTMESGEDPEDGLSGVDDYLTEANKNAEGKPLYEKYKRIRSEAMADLFSGVMDEMTFSRYKNDVIVFGMEPLGEEENGIVKFPLTMHVREFVPEKVRVDFNQAIPGIMEVKKWKPDSSRYVISRITFTWNEKEILFFDRFSSLMANIVAIPAVKQLIGNAIEDLNIHLKKGTQVLSSNDSDALTYLTLSGNNFKVNGLNLNFPKSDPMEVKVITHTEDGITNVVEMTGVWNGNQLINYVNQSNSQPSQQQNNTELDNLYVLARRALENANSTDCIRYYDQILREDPNSWEALFYSTYFRAAGCTNEQIAEAASLVGENLNTVFSLLQQYGGDPTVLVPVIADDVVRLETVLADAALQYFLMTGGTDKYTLGYNRATCAYALYSLGDQIENYYVNNPFLMQYALSAWRTGVGIHTASLSNQYNKAPHKNDIKFINSKIAFYSSRM